MRWHSGSDKELNQFFELLSSNEEVFANGQARLVLTAAVFHRSLEKLEFMRNSRKMKTRQQALQIKKVFEHVVDLKLSHYDLDAQKRRMSTLRGTLDVQIFRRLQIVTLQRVPMVLIENLATISSNIKQLRVHRCIYSLCELRGNLKDASNKLFHPKWPSLEAVDLSNNWLCGLDDSIQMFGSSNLHTFIISYNRIENFYDYLTYLPVVKRFDASFNQLSAIPTFTPTVYNHLSKLVLCANQLCSLRSISVLFYLEYLDVRDNLIARHIDLSDLKSLHILKHILLAGNPLCSHDQHFTKTMNNLSPRALMNYPVIDDNRVSPEQLQELQSRHPDLNWRGILDGNSARSSTDVQLSSKSTASADRNSRLPSIAERSTPSKNGSVSSSIHARKERANSGIRIKKAATFSHKTRPVQLTIPGHVTEAERMFQTSTPKSQKRLQKKASLTSVSESPVRFLAETEGDAYIQSYRSMKENMENLGIKKGILNDVVPDLGQGASSLTSRSPSKLIDQDESSGDKVNLLRRNSSASQKKATRANTESLTLTSKLNRTETANMRNDINNDKDNETSKYPVEIESNIMDNSEHGDAKGVEQIDVETEVVRMRPKDASRSSVSSNRDSRISQHSWSSSFFPNSFTQDGSDLHALSNEMDGFVEPIVQLEHRLHLHLSQQVLGDFEDFQQLFKGYLSSSQHPEIKPCALVVTSANIRFFHIVPTEEKQTSLDQVDSWFKLLASFPFETLLQLENGISDQSLHFKFKNTASAFVFVAFSRDLILNLVDVIIRWCLKYSYVNYSRSEKTVKTDMKLLDKLVLIKLKSGSVLSGHQSPGFETFSTSFETALKENCWLCRLSKYSNVLCLLTATDQHVCICAVNYFVVHTAGDQLKSKPFVLLDARAIPDIRNIVRYRNRRNVLSVNLFDKTQTSMIKHNDQRSDQCVWNIKFGNMKQVSDFVNLVRQKWESVYCTDMQNEVAAEPDANVVFFDDNLSHE